jgi:thiamine pyrophosphate-dependent acetolactate synthase large subunit-like protein
VTAIAAALVSLSSGVDPSSGLAGPSSGLAGPSSGLAGPSSGPAGPSSGSAGTDGGPDAGRVAKWRVRLGEEARAKGRRWVSTMDAIAGVLPRDTMVMADNAMACYYGALGNLPVHTPGGFCFPTGFGTLGYALPAAIGAAVAAPDRPVIALVGDGGLMFSVQELATAATEGVTLPVIVFVNGGYGEIRAQMRDAGITPLAVDLPAPDFVGLARSLGGHGVSAAGPDELAAELDAALRRPGPTVLVVDEPGEA